MRVGSVQSFVIGYPDPNDYLSRRMTTLARVETTDGVVGWGEGIAMWPEACRATKLLIDEGFAPLLVQAGETTIAEAWQSFRAHAWWYGEGGIASFAYSALDMALWDIKGKLEGKPLCDLLGRHRDSLPAYAANHVNKATLAENVAEVVGFKEQGFRGCKLGFAKKGLSNIGRDPDGDVAFVKALRQEVGPDFDIVVDAGNGVKWDRETGIATVRRMAEYDIGWIEEPFYPNRLDDYVALKAAVDVPIGIGEREWTVANYARLIDSGTVDVVGIDPARAEGITGFRAVDKLCGDAGITINAHAWSTGILSAASLNLSLASPNARLLELKPIPNVALVDLVHEPILQHGGMVEALSRPGLGIEVDESVVKRLAA